MPRARLPQLHSITDGSFEPNRKNPILLGDDDVLDTHHKVIKIGGENTPLSLNKDELRINGDLFLNGKLTSHLIECDSDYLTFRPNIYTRFESTNYTGTLDIYIASGDSYFLTSGDDFYFIAQTTGVFNYGLLGTDLSLFQINTTNSTLTLKNIADPSDMFTLEVTGDGVTNLRTVDDSGAVAHMTLNPDGDLILDPVSQKVIINATDKLYFDGGGNTYIKEGSADKMQFYTAATLALELSYPSAANRRIQFGLFSAGWTMQAATYNALDTEINFLTQGQKIICTFDGGDIADLNFTFPIVSGNFLLLLIQDGTGSRTVASDGWLAFDASGNAANGSARILWAGGTAPTLTTTAGKADIISIFWDATNENAYGTITYNF